MDTMAVAAIEKTEVQGARELPCREEICDIKTFEMKIHSNQSLRNSKHASKEDRRRARRKGKQQLCEAWLALNRRIKGLSLSNDKGCAS